MEVSRLRILSIGGFSGYGESNTCLHRTWALEELGEVDRIDTTKHYTIYLRIINSLFQKGFNLRFPDFSSVNKKIIALASQKYYDIIWIDKGIFINSSTLKKIKAINPKIKIVGYSPDDMSQRHNQSFNFIESLPSYDHYITTKSYIVEKLKKMGVKNVLFTDNAYEDKFHFPRKLNDIEKEKLGGDVGFIGAWEGERANTILFLAKNGINIRVWGGGEWNQYKNIFPNLQIEDKGLFSDDYSKALSSFKISLCFLRKMNFDLQTTRTMEIPACKGFLMAERTSEHSRLFTEGIEADFFSSDKELLEKCLFYLKNENKRLELVESGYRRCITSGYSNKSRIKLIVQEVITKS
ncbi:CgeB family protein [Flavobacterium salmonis]|uniref:Spore protein YkvP/CgeB glycosyl transferase-like domain-containing protein n=1 Tax=Flavobacterium salmonis TaxID=2654844 RepID=A0A6V6YYQ7_9FLAO|nr:glycosyltransferase [Flavobacterium salmonis]CAD0004613.1 hypothetical protein FLAT13_02375 [Flavobacterium salmonis]